MEDDFHATPISKLPPPAVQTRRPDNPSDGLPPPISMKKNEGKDFGPQDYNSLIKDMDGAPAGHAQQQHTYYDDDFPPRDIRDTPPPRYYAPPRQHHTTAAPLSPAPTQPIPASAAAAPQTSGITSFVKKYKAAIIVALIVLVMKVYGIPKLSASAPGLLSPVTSYNLTLAGNAVVAAVSGCMFAVLSAYL